MPKFHFAIPLPDHAGLIEAQQYLASKLPKGATLVDPADFRLTLLYVDDAEDATGWATPANLPPFGMGSDYVRTFDPRSDNGHAVVLAIQANPQLNYLQAGLFYEAQAQGASVGSYSWPGMWKPHVTLAYSPSCLHDIDDCSHHIDDWIYHILPSLVVMEATEFVLHGEDGEVLQRYPFTATISQTAQISEMKVIRDAVMVCEFKGKFPTVPTFADVDVGALTAGDDDPTFVTLPIAKDGMISAAPNKRHYSAAFVAEMERQIYEKRPVGNQGHVAKEDRATEYPTPVLYWVGTSKVGDTLFGKAYAPISEARDMIKKTRDVKGKIATSLYGMGTEAWNAELGAWDVNVDSFSLESIDLAPPDRAGVGDLAAIPHLTSEMKDATDTSKTKQEITPMGTDTDEKKPKDTVTVADRATIISEMTEKDSVLLPDVVRDAVLAVAPQTKLVAEMREALGVDEKADPVVTIKALVAEMTEIKEKSLVAEIKTAVDDAIQVETVRPVVLALVNARKPEAGKVADVVKEIADSAEIKPLLENALVSEMGGRQTRPADKTSQNGDSGETSMISTKGKARMEKAKAEANA